MAKTSMLCSQAKGTQSGKEEPRHIWNLHSGGICSSLCRQRSQVESYIRLKRSKSNLGLLRPSGHEDHEKEERRISEKQAHHTPSFLLKNLPDSTLHGVIKSLKLDKI